MTTENQSALDQFENTTTGRAYVDFLSYQYLNSNLGNAKQQK